MGVQVNPGIDLFDFRTTDGDKMTWGLTST